MNQFFASTTDPILNDPVCLGVREWLQLSPGKTKAAQGAELYDRLLLACAADGSGSHKYAPVTRTVWAFTHLSRLLILFVEDCLKKQGHLPSPEVVQRWLAYARVQIFSVDPVVPLTHGIAAVGRTATETRYAVQLNHHWPFERVLLPHDGGEPIWEPYDEWGEIPLSALSNRGKDKFDTTLRMAWALRQQLAWIIQQLPEDGAAARGAFASPPGARSNAIILKGQSGTQRYVLPIWDATAPLLSKVADPLRPESRRLRAKSFEDLFGNGALGEDYQIVLKITKEYDPGASPDVVGYIRSLVKKRRIDAARKLTGRAIDGRTVAISNPDVFDAHAGHALGLYPGGKLAKQDSNELAIRHDPAALGALLRSTDIDKALGKSELIGAFDGASDTSGGWAAKSRSHGTDSARLGKAGDDVMRQIASKLDLAAYYQSLSPAKQAAMLVVMANRGEPSTRISGQIMADVFKATSGLIEERTARAYADEIKKRVAEIEAAR